MVASALFSRPIPRHAGGRLTLATGDPAPSTDQTAKTTVYYTPADSIPGGSNRIALKTGNFWIDRAFSEAQLTVPSTQFRPFDVFGYWDPSALSGAGNIALEAVNWNQSSGAITSCTNATPVVLTVASGHGVVAGDVIAITGMSTSLLLNGHTFYVSAVTATTITLEDSQAAGAGTGGTWFKLTNTRATALALDGGNVVKSGDATRRYLGTGCTWATSGQTADAEAFRLLFNAANQVPRNVRIWDVTDSWTNSAIGWRIANKANAGMANSIYAVCGLVTQLDLENAVSFQSGAAQRWGGPGIGIDRSTVNVAQLYGGVSVSTSYDNVRASYRGSLAIGAHAIRPIENISATGTNLIWYGDAGASASYSSGIAGTILQ